MRSELRPLPLFIKAVTLFVIANLLIGIFNPPFYNLSLYNKVFPGRVRLPFGTDGGIYGVMVDNLDVMMASHQISAPKADDEFRVVLIGDSSVWGEGAHVSQSIAVLWNQTEPGCNGRKIKYYNLAYPHPSVVKDLIILDKAMEFDPDLVLWFVTLNTLTPRRLSPFIRANADRAERVLNTHDIPFDLDDVATTGGFNAFYEKTLIGQRSDLARMLRLQAVGLLWAMTGTDSYEPETRTVHQDNDVSADIIYKGTETPDELQDQIMWNALTAGHQIAGQVPIMIINEPIFIATGTNSDVRYNSGYPRWAYDYYRAELQSKSQMNQWNYLDLWDSVPAAYFPDGVIHVSPEGRHVIIEKTDPEVQNIACR